MNKKNGVICKQLIEIPWKSEPHLPPVIDGNHIGINCHLRSTTNQKWRKCFCPIEVSRFLFDLLLAQPGHFGNCPPIKD